jgi:dGTPase
MDGALGTQRDDRPRPLAVFAVRGTEDDPLSSRTHPENVHAYRTAFERDCGRVIHAKSFRRLAGKTQVLTNRFSDHSRNRLTHTLEVKQIARTVAGALGLNQELAETLALVHDIGHPPFGHAGERALDRQMRALGLRFDHNLHALRIVEYFEQRYAAHPGLNLTLGVREGVVKHSRDYSISEHPELSEYFLDERPPLEAQLIDLADEIAYLTTDLEDGIEAGILHLEDARANVQIFERAYTRMLDEHPNTAGKLLLAGALTRMLNLLTSDLIHETTRRVKRANVASLEAIRKHPERLASLSPEMEAERARAKSYLKSSLHVSEEIQRDHQQADEIVTDMFEHWLAHPETLPPSHAALAASEGAPRVVADYIAGMTDNFIVKAWQDLRDPGNRL